MFQFLNRLGVRNRIWAIVAFLIASIVVGSMIDVVMLREALWREKELKTRQLVDGAFSVVSHFHELQSRGVLTEAEAQSAAISTVRAMRYDGKEYFWINDLGTPFPRMIMHPTLPSLEGQVLDRPEFERATALRVGTDGPFTTTDGRKNLFVAFVEVVNAGGHGYVTYTWQKPKGVTGVSDEVYPKLSYVRKFAPWGWLVGSGIHIDDVERALRELAMRHLMLVLGVGVVLLVVAGLIARSITRPLQLTVETMRAIGKGGGPAQRLPAEGDSELAELATSFNEMLDRLEARDAQLARHRDELEAQVAKRTAELRYTNERLAAEQREIEALLHKMEEAQSQLLQSEKMAAIGQLAAGVAHEINNPVGFVNSNLGTLKSYVEGLLTVIEAYERSHAAQAEPEHVAAAKREIDYEFLRQDVAELLGESRDGLERVKKIVQDLKNFSHIDRAEWEEADLNAGLDSTLNVVRNELKYKADVVRDYGELPAVRCLPGQLNQVFLNLLVNAAHAIDTHGTITVRTGCEDAWVWVAVSDTGHGMSADVQRRVFEPFFTTKPVGKGTGLGLSLAYDIVVKKHGGRFDIESEPGFGTTFRVWLPIDGVPPGESAQDELPDASDAATVPARRAA